MTSSLTVKMNVTVTRSQHEEIKRLVKEGGYASESEVIREGLRLLSEVKKESLSAKAFESRVAMAYDKLKNTPSTRRTTKQVMDSLGKAAKQRHKAKG